MDNKLKILNFLAKNSHQQFTMHQLSKLLKIPYATFYRTIKSMNKLLIVETVGKAKIIKINFKHPVIKSYLAIASEQEKQEYLKKQHLIKQIVNKINTDDIVLLFGSYADQTHSSRSDIDLMIINRDGKKTLSFSGFELLFKKEVNPMFFTRKEYKLMLRDINENVGKQAKKKHIVLNNPYVFWDLTLNAI